MKKLNDKIKSTKDMDKINSLIDDVIEKTLKKVKLLEELRSSIAYENCEYIIRKTNSNQDGLYMLYKKLDNKMIEEHFEIGLNNQTEKFSHFLLRQYNKKMKKNNEDLFNVIMQEHLEEIYKKNAEPFNLGWVQTDTSIESKTSEGILYTEYNKKTKKYIHKWWNKNE